MTTENLIECGICNRKQSHANCNACVSKVRSFLAKIPHLHAESQNNLEPVSGSHGAGSSERPIGINVMALDYSMANDLLAVLWGWESIIRMELHLTSPALLPLLRNRHEQVLDTCTFHITMLEHSRKQEWFSEFFNEIMKQHGLGMNAARLVEPKPQRISCPATASDGIPCGRMLSLETEDMESLIYCFGCKTEWSPARLVAVKVSDTSQTWWIDLEAAAGFLQLTERHLRKVAKAKNVKRRGQLYDLQELIAARK